MLVEFSVTFATANAGVGLNRIFRSAVTTRPLESFTCAVTRFIPGCNGTVVLHDVVPLAVAENPRSVLTKTEMLVPLALPLTLVDEVLTVVSLDGVVIEIVGQPLLVADQLIVCVVTAPSSSETRTVAVKFPGTPTRRVAFGLYGLAMTGAPSPKSQTTRAMAPSGSSPLMPNVCVPGTLLNEVGVNVGVMLGGVLLAGFTTSDKSSACTTCVRPGPPKYPT